MVISWPVEIVHLLRFSKPAFFSISSVDILKKNCVGQEIKFHRYGWDFFEFYNLTGQFFFSIKKLFFVHRTNFFFFFDCFQPDPVVRVPSLKCVFFFYKNLIITMTLSYDKRVVELGEKKKKEKKIRLMNRKYRIRPFIKK